MRDEFASSPLLARGFSLIEVLAVVALISVVMFVALNFYTDLARATARASEHTHEIRRAVAILDRVARDFESAMLVVKPAELDPISHPWLFIGESKLGDLGADHVKFVTRNHDPTRSENPESDLAMVSYTVEQDEDGLLTLYRWSSPQLPEQLEDEFPFPDDERSHPMAFGLDSFGIEFIGPGGETSSEWNSTTLVQSSTMPTAVQINIALHNEDLGEDEEPVIYQRLALIRVPPLDMEQLLDPTATGNNGAGDEDDDDEPGKDKNGSGNSKNRKSKSRDDNIARTMGECVILSQIDQSDLLGAGLAGLIAANPGAQWEPSLASTLPANAINPACR